MNDIKQQLPKNKEQPTIDPKVNLKVVGDSNSNFEKNSKKS